MYQKQKVLCDLLFTLQSYVIEIYTNIKNMLLSPWILVTNFISGYFIFSGAALCNFHAFFHLATQPGLTMSKQRCEKIVMSMTWMRIRIKIDRIRI